jgi:hypothetical protein
MVWRRSSSFKRVLVGHSGMGNDDEINRLPGAISALTLVAKRFITIGDKKA